MRILIQEFATGGGLNQEDLHSDLLIEGFGMLRLLIDNFTRLGLEVVTTLDNRIAFISKVTCAQQIKIIKNTDSFLQDSIDLLDSCDYFLIIAPETDNILENIVNEYQKKSTAISYNCSPTAIHLATHKSKMYSFCLENNIQFPKTILIDKYTHIEDLLDDLPFQLPIIIKPDDGVACEGIRLCNTRDELEESLNLLNTRKFLLQEYIEGENLSVSLKVANNDIDLLSLNKQIISLNYEASSYLGSICNVKHKMKEKIDDISRDISSKIPGINGFIGFDFICTKENEIYFIELNPRATTSFCGLIDTNNPAIAMDSNYQKHNKIGYFSKLEFTDIGKLTQNEILEICKEPSLVSPPFFPTNESAYAIMRGFGKTECKAKKDYLNNVNNLSNNLKKEE